jgi:hypothetical protein
LIRRSRGEGLYHLCFIEACLGFFQSFEGDRMLWIPFFLGGGVLKAPFLS